MMTTRAVLLALRRANPGAPVTEDRVRHAIRRGAVDPPPQFAGRYQWTPDSVRALAKALGLVAPPSRKGAASDVHEERVGGRLKQKHPSPADPIKESRHGAEGDYK